MRKLQSGGFTLIELLIVMAIIGILASAIGGNFITSRIRARDADRKESLNQVRKALELYYNDAGKYPAADNGRIRPYADPKTGALGNVVQWGNAFVDNNNTIYMKQTPNDTNQPFSQYRYEVNSTGQKFRVYTRLENLQDIDTDLDKDGTPGDSYDGTKGDDVARLCGTKAGNYCNFGISSTNSNMAEVY